MNEAIRNVDAAMLDAVDRVLELPVFERPFGADKIIAELAGERRLAAIEALRVLAPGVRAVEVKLSYPGGTSRYLEVVPGGNDGPIYLPCGSDSSDLSDCAELVGFLVKDGDGVSVGDGCDEAQLRALYVALLGLNAEPQSDGATRLLQLVFDLAVLLQRDCETDERIPIQQEQGNRHD